MTPAGTRAGGNGQQQAGVRPAVLSLSIKEKAALYAAYMPYLKNGGIFVPTTRPYQFGDDVYLILTLLDDTDPDSGGRQGRVDQPGGRRQQDAGHRRALPGGRVGARPRASASRTPWVRL